MWNWTEFQFDPEVSKRKSKIQLPPPTTKSSITPHEEQNNSNYSHLFCSVKNTHVLISITWSRNIDISIFNRLSNSKTSPTTTRSGSFTPTLWETENDHRVFYVNLSLKNTSKVKINYPGPLFLSLIYLLLNLLINIEGNSELKLKECCFPRK